MPLHVVIAKAIDKALGDERKGWVIWVVIGLVMLFALSLRHH
jgi:hypothetical protein